jgi:hypothetical protein
MKIPSVERFKRLIIRNPKAYLKVPRMCKTATQLRSYPAYPWYVPLSSVFRALFVDVELGERDLAGLVVVGSAVARHWEWTGFNQDLGGYHKPTKKKVHEAQDVDILVVTRYRFSDVTRGSKVNWEWVPDAYGSYVRNVLGTIHLIGASSENAERWRNEVSHYGWLLIGNLNAVESVIGARPPHLAWWRRGILRSPRCGVKMRLREVPWDQEPREPGRGEEL